MRGVLLETSTGALLPMKGTDDGNGRATLDLSAGITLSASELKLGAVELEDKTSGNRACIDSAGQVNTVTQNRADFKVREIDTGGVANTEQVGPSQAVPDGFGVAIIADSANTTTVQVGSVGESGTAGQFFVLQPGDRFPITLKVGDMDQIAARSVTGTNQKLHLIVEV